MSHILIQVGQSNDVIVNTIANRVLGEVKAGGSDFSQEHILAETSNVQKHFENIRAMLKEKQSVQTLSDNEAINHQINEEIGNFIYS